MDSLTSLRVFCAVAELKGFTAAAERLGISPAMASKHVMQLEDRLGVRLLNRTSRRVSLTETGLNYFSQTRQMLESLDELEAAIGNVTIAPRGTLKLSAPVWVANSYFADVFANYHQRYPDVCLDLDLSGRIVNLVEDGFDLALRATARDRLDPGLVMRELADVKFMMLGAPDYLNKTGRPQAIPELNGHALLRYSAMSLGESLSFAGIDGVHKVTFRSVMVSDNENVLHLAALRGLGLVFLPQWMVRDDLQSGRPEVVLPDTVSFTTTLHAVYPSRKHLSAKVRTFIDFLEDHVQEL